MAGADSLGRTGVRVSLDGAELCTVLVLPRRYFGTVHQLAEITGGGRASVLSVAGKECVAF